MWDVFASCIERTSRSGCQGCSLTGAASVFETIPSSETIFTLYFESLPGFSCPFYFLFFFFLKKRFRSSRATIRQLPAPALKLGVCQVNSDRVTASEHGAG
jgi:hypothetical protein